MKTKVSSKKSGFTEGRSKSGPSRSSISNKKEQPRDPDRKAKQRLDKLKQAQNDLAEAMKDIELDNNNVIDAEAIDDTGEVASRFAKDFNRIRQNVLKSGEEFNAESAQRMLLKTLFAMNMDLIPVAEKAYRDSKKEQAGYILIGIQNQASEQAMQLKLLGNVEHQSGYIKESIIDPLFMALLQTFMSQCMHLKQTVDTNTANQKVAKPIKQEIDNILRSVGTFLDASRMSMGTNIGKYLAGDMSFLGNEDSGGLGKKKRGAKRERN